MPFERDSELVGYAFPAQRQGELCLMPCQLKEKVFSATAAMKADHGKEQAMRSVKKGG